MRLSTPKSRQYQRPAEATHGRGFASNRQHPWPWLVLPVELSLARLAGPVGSELTGSALVALVEHDFAIDGHRRRSPLADGWRDARAARLPAIFQANNFGHQPRPGP
jgi:hypothetical protein